jgi:hypothetical protein
MPRVRVRVRRRRDWKLKKGASSPVHQRSNEVAEDWLIEQGLPRDPGRMIMQRKKSLKGNFGTRINSVP